jgi:3-hydroxy acid dehydrogenase / malonic semialdehyde reductase
MNKIALVTGATSGIGYATAKIFAENKIDLIICGRRTDKLAQLESEISGKVKVFKLSFDVSNRDSVFEALNSLPQNWKKIDILINNAGSAHGLDTVETANLDDWDKMIDINVKGLMYVTKAILPWMIEEQSGHIVNISSIAGKEVYLKGNAYCASKHAVDAFNSGLRIDLMGKGIKVSVINPGAVNTEFSTVRFKGDTKKADKIYEGFEPLVAHDIADLIYFVVSRPKHINISDTTILPNAQVTATQIHRK